MITSSRIRLLLSLLILAAGATEAAEPWRFEGVDRVVAISDIHGAQDAFVRILKRSGLVGDKLQWIGGSDHLVVVGDVLDRGPDSRRALDLIRALQREAQAAGGGVHLVLGNHEVMNLVGDLRYVSEAEFAAFATEEDAAQRDDVFAELSTRDADSIPTRSDFDAKYPGGFFGQRAAFAPMGEYGAWLLEQPLLVVINDTAFVHGGLSQTVEDFDGARLNAELGRELRDYTTALQSLIAGGILSPTDNFYDQPAALESFARRVQAGQASWPPDLEATAARLEMLNDALLFEEQSPVWYRGTVACSELIERDRLSQALAALGVRRLVVGHTPTPDARVLSRMDGRVIRIDAGMLANYFHGRAAALVIENGELHALYADGDGAAPPVPQPRRVADALPDLDTQALEALLSQAPIVKREDSGGHVHVLLRQGVVEVAAQFIPAPRASFRPEVAAYRLDRLLGLGMVPVTVARDLDGMTGALQLLVPNAITESERRAQGIAAAAWCPLRDQFQAMYVFDTLIFNQGRTADDIAYAPPSFGLILLGHERAFAAARGRPTHLANLQLVIGPAWREALNSLSRDRLEEAVGGLLSRRQIDAIERRRDALLALPE